MRRLLYAAIGICIGLLSVSSYSQYKISEKEEISDRITRRVAKKLHEKLKLRPMGSGGQMMYEVVMLGLSLGYDGELDLRRGRELLIASVNEYLTEINSDESIRPFLSHYPFDSKNIEIRIFVFNSDRTTPAKGKMSVLSAINGVFQYKTDDESRNLQSLHKETYEQAIAKSLIMKGLE